VSSINERRGELDMEDADEYAFFMQLLKVVAAFLGIAFAMGSGLLLAMKGGAYCFPLVIVFLGWAFAFAKLGCLPPKDSH
jgi:hypothetical protein